MGISDDYLLCIAEFRVKNSRSFPEDNEKNYKIKNERRMNGCQDTLCERTVPELDPE